MNKRPMVTMITRHWPAGRKRSFERFTQSLSAVEWPGDFEHIVSEDPTPGGMGLAWADAAVARLIPMAKGEYVWIVDDDDEVCPDAGLIIHAAIAASHWPDVIVVQGEFGHNGILPTRAVVAAGRPIWGGISGQNVVVRRELAISCADGWIEPPNGDIHYMEQLWAKPMRQVWVNNKILVRQQRNGQGRPDWE